MPRPESVAASAPAEQEVAPLVPFNLTTFERLPGGEFRLGFKGKPGERYYIETSTNLMTWLRLGEVTNKTGRTGFCGRGRGQLRVAVLSGGAHPVIAQFFVRQDFGATSMREN